MTAQHDKGGSGSPLMQAATWMREHRASGSPAHTCDPVEFKDEAGFVVAAFCGVCGRCVSYRPNGYSRETPASPPSVRATG